MARRGMSISVKMIGLSTVLLTVVIGLFGAANTMQSRRIIDEAANRLQAKITETLRSAGSAQLELLAEATRIALVQNDYSTLQSIVENTMKHDERIVAAAVVDKSGTVVANGDAHRVGGKADGPLAQAVAANKATVKTEELGDGKKAMTFAVPVVHEQVRLCTVFMAYSLSLLETELAKARTLKVKELKSNLQTMLIIGLLAVAVGVILTILQGIRITSPIQALARQADQIANGDLQARVVVKSGDEIGFLGDRFNYMAEQVLHLMNETVKKAAMEKELEVASAIQATLVPDASVAQIGRLKLAGYFKPATQCGGDWWSYYQLADEKVLIVIGDVTGHGVASAMITAAAKGSATTVSAMSGGRLDLPMLLAAMNTAIHDAAHGQFVMTCFAAIYDQAKQTLTYANAGHNFPYLYDAQTQKLASLVVRGNRLGDVEGGSFEIKSMPVKADDTLFLYTDGIVECEDMRGEEYGERRFRATLAKHASLPADEARDRVVGVANHFFGEMPPKDDITLVVGKFV